MKASLYVGTILLLWRVVVAPVCDACAGGTYESAACTDTEDRICTACTAIDNCDAVTCGSASNQICTTCTAGFFGDGTSSCATCTAIDNCDAVTCGSASNQICTTCTTGFYSDTSSTCVGCAIIFDCDIVTCNSGTDEICGTCSDGFYGDGTTSCTDCTAITNCDTFTCTTGSDQVCSNCTTGFYGDGTSACTDCTVIADCDLITCSSDTDKICSKCTVGFYGDGTPSCTGCPAIDKCDFVTCSNATDGVCDDCSNGFYLDAATSICSACGANCAECGSLATDGCSICNSDNNGVFSLDVNDTDCVLACNDGYFSPDPISDGASCSACGVACKVCSNATTCTTCHDNPADGAFTDNGDGTCSLTCEAGFLQVKGATDDLDTCLATISVPCASGCNYQGVEFELTIPAGAADLAGGVTVDGLNASTLSTQPTALAAIELGPSTSFTSEVTVCLKVAAPEGEYLKFVHSSDAGATWSDLGNVTYAPASGLLCGETLSFSIFAAISAQKNCTEDGAGQLPCLGRANTCTDLFPGYSCSCDLPYTGSIVNNSGDASCSIEVSSVHKFLTYLGASVLGALYILVWGALLQGLCYK